MHLLMEIRLRHGEYKERGLATWHIKLKLIREFGVDIAYRYWKKWGVA